MARHPRHPARSPRTRARGVTLLEMLLVVGLIALVSGLTAVVLGGGLEGLRLRAAAKDVASQLRHTRAQALATGREQRFVIEPGAHRWHTSASREGRIPESLEVVFTGAREALPVQGRGAVLFFPDGGSTGGRVRLRARDAAWHVDVSWVTGEVRLTRPAPTGGAQ